MKLSRVSPLNLPAKATMQIAGNPVTSRPESVVGNCFPGLEIDHRNLDRRFFPGLVFDFVSIPAGNPDSGLIGARLVDVDLSDPVVRQQDQDFLARLQELQAALAAGKSLFIHSLQQEDGSIIKLWREDKPLIPLDGLVVWRLVRSLREKKVSVVLAERDASGSSNAFAPLTADRKIYQDKEGLLSTAYQPGELSQSLCSPWQHDFRDCGCNYWASNHPDIVMAEHPANPEELKSNIPEADHAERRLLWLRWDQTHEVAALPTRDQCRPLEMDHYEINHRWQELPIVLEGRETRTPYALDSVHKAPPFENLTLLVDKLRELAAIEHALALEYLYARYTMRVKRPGDDMSDTEGEHADYIAHELLMIASSEMMHLRWANQLLCELWQRGYTGEFTPQLAVATYVPKVGGYRKVQMRTLDRALEDFISAEQPSSSVDGQYARVFATLRHGYPPSMAELASRVIADGVSHFARFRELRAILISHHPEQKASCRRGGVPQASSLVLNIEKPASMACPELGCIVNLYTELMAHLNAGLRTGHADERIALADARQLMAKIDDQALRLASLNPPVGIPFSEIGYSVAGRFENGPKSGDQG